MVKYSNNSLLCTSTLFPVMDWPPVSGHLTGWFPAEQKPAILDVSHDCGRAFFSFVNTHKTGAILRTVIYSSDGLVA